MSTARGARLAWLTQSRQPLDALPLDEYFELPGRPHVVYQIRSYANTANPKEAAAEARSDLPFLFKSFETGQIGPKRMAKMHGGKARVATIHEYLDWTVTGVRAEGDDELDFSGFRVVVILPRYVSHWPYPGDPSSQEGTKAHPDLGAPLPPYPILQSHGRPMCAATVRSGPGYLEVPFVATQEHKRGRGYCRCLVEAIEDIARALGLPKLMLCSTNDPVVKSTWHHLNFDFASEEEMAAWDIPHADLVYLQNTTQMHKVVAPRGRYKPIMIQHQGYKQRTYARLDEVVKRPRLHAGPAKRPGKVPKKSSGRATVAAASHAAQGNASVQACSLVPPNGPLEQEHQPVRHISVPDTPPQHPPGSYSKATGGGAGAVGGSGATGLRPTPSGATQPSLSAATQPSPSAATHPHHSGAAGHSQQGGGTEQGTTHTHAESGTCTESRATTRSRSRGQRHQQGEQGGSYSRSRSKGGTHSRSRSHSQDARSPSFHTGENGGAAGGSSSSASPSQQRDEGGSGSYFAWRRQQQQQQQQLQQQGGEQQQQQQPLRNMPPGKVRVHRSESLNQGQLQLLEQHHHHLVHMAQQEQHQQGMQQPLPMEWEPQMGLEQQQQLQLPLPPPPSPPPLLHLPPPPPPPPELQALLQQQEQQMLLQQQHVQLQEAQQGQGVGIQGNGHVAGGGGGPGELAQQKQRTAPGSAVSTRSTRAQQKQQQQQQQGVAPNPQDPH